MVTLCFRSGELPSPSSYCCPYSSSSDDRARYCVDWIASVQMHQRLSRTTSCPPIAEACELEACDAAGFSRRLRRNASASQPSKRTLIRTNPWVAPTAIRPVSWSCGVGTFAVGQIAANDVLASIRPPPIEHLPTSAPSCDRRNADGGSRRWRRCESRTSIRSDSASSDGYHSSCSKDSDSSSCNQATAPTCSYVVQNGPYGMLCRPSDADEVFSSPLRHGDITAGETRWWLRRTPTFDSCWGVQEISRPSIGQCASSNLGVGHGPCQLHVADGRFLHLPGLSNSPAAFSCCVNARDSRLAIMPFKKSHSNCAAVPPPYTNAMTTHERHCQRLSGQEDDWSCSCELVRNDGNSARPETRRKEFLGDAGGSRWSNGELCERRLTLSEKVHRLCASRDTLREIIRLAKMECEHLAMDSDVSAASELLP